MTSENAQKETPGIEIPGVLVTKLLNAAEAVRQPPPTAVSPDPSLRLAHAFAGVSLSPEPWRFYNSTYVPVVQSLRSASPCFSEKLRNERDFAGNGGFWFPHVVIVQQTSVLTAAEKGN